MDTHLPPRWRERTCYVIGAKATPENLRFLQAWSVAEGGTAKWNPLNSTLVVQGVTIYNTFVANGVTIHVWNYPRPTWGVCATAMTLTNGNYNTLLGHLQAGTFTAEQILADCDAEIRVWGTNPDAIKAALTA